MNRTKRLQSSSSGDFDGSTKANTAMEGESYVGVGQNTESPTQQNVIGFSSAGIGHETHYLQALQQQQRFDSRRSLVAAVLAEDRDRKIASSSHASLTTTATSSAVVPQSSTFHLNPNERSSDDQVQWINSSDQEQLVDIQLQQQILLYQQNQAQQQRHSYENVSSLHPQGLFHIYNGYQQLTLNERLQLHASAMHQPTHINTGNIFSEFLHNSHLGLNDFDAQLRQRQLVELLAVRQEQQRSLWFLTSTDNRQSLVSSVTHQDPQPCTPNVPSASTDGLAQDEMRCLQTGASVDATVTNHLSVLTATAPVNVRPQKKKTATQRTKSGKSKPSKTAPNLELECNFKPDNMRELSLPSDSETLSEYQCMLRQQIVLFTVGTADIECNAQGRNKPIVLGQVGTLCRYCAKLKPSQRPSGAVYFPAKLSGLYQASQNMSINHFSSNCQSIPEPVRQKMFKLKIQKSTVLGGGKLFWANCAKMIGVVELDDQLGFADMSETTEGTSL